MAQRNDLPKNQRSMVRSIQRLAFKLIVMRWAWAGSSILLSLLYKLLIPGLQNYLVRTGSRSGGNSVKGRTLLRRRRASLGNLVKLLSETVANGVCRGRMALPYSSLAGILRLEPVKCEA